MTFINRRLQITDNPCDECGGIDNVEWYGSITGQIVVDKQNMRWVYLCKKHYPKGGAHQPTEASRVRFYWPNKPEWNE